jgi:hypothetical protein
VDAAALALYRPAQRREHVLEALREDGRRLLDEARPGTVAVVYAETSDGVALVLPIAAGGDLPPRAERLARCAAAALADAAALPAAPQSAGDAELEAARWEGQVALRATHPTPADVLELLPLTLEDHAQDLDRVRLGPVPLLAGDLDETEPAADERWLWRAEMAARFGGRPGAATLAPEVEAAVARLETFAPEAAVDTAIADDPLPRRRAARRLLRRLDGMGKYGGYHTEFRHLARGFAGHERALALEVAEALLRAGLLAEKPSVGQRHVSLVAARTSEIRTLVERGTCDEPLRSLLAH